MAEMFLKLKDVLGESIDSATPVAHKDEIELTSWSWVTDNKIKWDINQGGQSTKVDVHHIEVNKVCDKASVMLYQCCVTGKHIRDGVITCRKNDGDQKVEYLIVTLKDIMVSKVEWQGNGDEQALKEVVWLSFAEFFLDYKVQTETGTAAPGANTFGFNIQKQQKT